MTPLEEQLTRQLQECRAAPEAWRCIGQEVSEQLDYEPVRFRRRRLIGRRYVHRTEIDHPPIIAALPGKLLERGLAVPGLLAQMIVSKYCDHCVPRATDRTMNSVCCATA